MGRVQVRADGKVPPRRFNDPLADAGPDRSRWWGNSVAGVHVVRDQGDTWADVTEGTSASMIWQRYHYEWSTPGHIRLDVAARLRRGFPP